MIATSIEQSRILGEFIDINTADMKYVWSEEDEDYSIYPRPKIHLNDRDIPAWSLEALWKILPASINTINNEYCVYSAKDIDNDKVVYSIWYSSPIEPFYYEVNENNPTDAAFKMICLLKENGDL